jgi:DNA repair protein RadC
MKYTDKERQIIEKAFHIMERNSEGDFFTSSNDTVDYLKLRIAHEEREHFTVIFLTSKNERIACEDLFKGTIDGAAVYPREVAKRALGLNAAAVIFGHNHPSGDPTPSDADKQITRRLVDALGLLQIRVLDHVIVTTNDYYSFAQGGDL